jgi:tetratricopeptide (TPR) repeat protein
LTSFSPNYILKWFVEFTTFSVASTTRITFPQGVPIRRRRFTRAGDFMSNYNSDFDDNGVSAATASAFDIAIDKARALYADGDLDEALATLNTIETQYIRAAKLFDLLGDVLIEQDNLAEGIRCKTLYEVLKGTFNILTQESQRHCMPTTAPAAEFPARTTAEDIDFGSIDGPEEQSAAPLPVTLSMGNLCLGQGHFDKALDIFTKLANANPDDTNVRNALQLAKKKRGEKQLLGVLKNWLKGIRVLKSDEET